MRMLYWMFSKGRWYKIRNNTIREGVRVTPIVEKKIGNKFRWFRHVERRHVDDAVRRVV